MNEDKLAVLFDGVFGGDMVFSSPPNVTTIPSAVLVALFAVIGTGSVAKRVFRPKNDRRCAAGRGPAGLTVSRPRGRQSTV